jgi:SAM-dependent methyltransferase
VKYFFITVFILSNTYSNKLEQSYCFTPFETYLRLHSKSEDLVKQYIKSRIKLNKKIILDIGGEGKIKGALNLNPQPLTSTANNSEDFFSNWLPGMGNSIPFQDNLVDTIYVQHAPISKKTMEEMKRVLKPGGNISLTHPKDYTDNYLNDLKEVFDNSTIKRIDDIHYSIIEIIPR